MDEELASLARVAASSLDAHAHATMTRPEQQNTPEYLAVVAPLRRIIAAAPTIKFLYTVRNSPEGPRFVVDAAEPIDGDGDGVVDQATLGEVYTDADPYLLRSLDTGEAQQTAEPATDKWGCFMSAFAPVYRADGTIECILGLDVTADSYQARVERMDRAIWLGIGVSVLASAALGLGVFALQRRRQAAAIALQASESRFRQLFDAVPVMVWLTGPDGGCTGLNRGWLDFTGRPLEEQLGNAWWNLVHTDDIELCLDTYRSAFAARSPWQLEYRLRCRDGSWRWVTTRGMPRYGEAGRFDGYVGGSMDTTERRRADAERASMLDLATGLAQSANRKEAARAVNDAVQRITGLERSAVLLFEDDGVCRFVGWRGISRAYRMRVEGHCPWKQGQLEATPILVHDAAADPLFADYRDLFESEGIRTLAFIPIITEQGVVGKLMLYGAEPGELTSARIDSACSAGSSLGVAVGRLNAQVALERSERRVRQIIDTAMDAVVSLDEAGIVTNWNFQAEQIFGYSHLDTLGKPLHTLILPKEQHDAHLNRLRELAEQCLGTGCRVESPAVTASGKTIFVEWAMTMVRTGDRSAYSVFLRDITGRKEAERNLLDAMHALEAASRAKTEFLANMSHEIRTPMTAILGFADLLADDDSSTPEGRRDIVSTIRRNGEHLLAVINDILDVSKIEAGKVTVEHIHTDPVQIVEDVISLMRVRAQAKGISLAHSYDTPMPRSILSDPVKLRQILVNLVGNAIKFTEHGGVRVAVRLEAPADGTSRLAFDVRDSGIGIPEDRLPQLFHAFSQADSTTTRRFGGTGLGLRISRSLAQLLGGDVSVRSVVGDGSTFTAFVLAEGCAEVRPVGEEPTIHPEAEPGRSAVSLPFLKGCRVLLADDGLDNRRLIEHHLRRAGAVVTSVENGQLALEALSGPDGTLRSPPPFDVVLMDMQMPVMDGYSTTSRIRELGGSIPVIALTAHAMSGDRDRCLAAGCDDYETKPISAPRLLEAVARHGMAGNSAERPAA